MMLKKCFFVVLFVSGLAESASFDCTKATSKVDRLICDTPALSKADDELSVDYLHAKLVTGNSDDFKSLVKQNWKLRQNNCDNETCLLDWYKRSTAIYRNISSQGSTPELKPKNKLANMDALPKGKTIDDFFLENKQLSTFKIKRAIKNLAYSLSTMDAITSNNSNKSKLKIASDQLNSNGYDYAELAVGQIKEFCMAGMASVSDLNESDCRIIASYNK